MIKTALASFGMSGKVFHAPFIEINPHFELVGAWERSSKQITNAYPHTKSFDSFEEILNDASIELVIINTPNDTHYEFTKRALEAGKHVVTEKAFTNTYQEALELDGIAHKQNKKLAVYHNRRYDADFQTIQQLIQEDKIGKILDMHISFERFRNDLSPKKHKEQLTPGAGVLFDLGPHLMDQALLLSGIPEAIFADIRITRSVSVVDDYFTIIMIYPHHRITLTSGMVFMQQGPGYRIFGDKGSFIKDRSDVQENDLIAGKSVLDSNWGAEDPKHYGTLSSLQADNSITQQIIPSIPGNYGKFYELMAKAILNNKPVPTTAAEGATIIRMLEIARKSNAERKVIPVSL